MANSVDSDQTAPIVCSGPTLFASILTDSLVMLGNYLQQTTSADDIFRCIFFLGAFRVKSHDGIMRNTMKRRRRFNVIDTLRHAFISIHGCSGESYHYSH